MNPPSDNTRRGSTKADLAALRALDVAMASQEMESELRSVLRALLPVLDGIDRLCRHLDREPADVVARKAEALAMLADMADAAAERVGLVRSGRIGDRVDGDAQEVIQVVADSSKPTGTILEVVENGWTYDGVLLRRARVVSSTRS